MLFNPAASTGIFALALSLLALNAPTVCAQTKPDIPIGANDIGGRVAGPGGPEAGAWVIAETTDLPTKFAKIVVTDDAGRFVIPELPNAK
jgi:hypothetical protein